MRPPHCPQIWLAFPKSLKPLRPFVTVTSYEIIYICPCVYIALIHIMSLYASFISNLS